MKINKLAQKYLILLYNNLITCKFAKHEPLHFENNYFIYLTFSK